MISKFRLTVIQTEFVLDHPTSNGIDTALHGIDCIVLRGCRVSLQRQIQLCAIRIRVGFWKVLLNDLK